MNDKNGIQIKHLLNKTQNFRDGLDERNEVTEFIKSSYLQMRYHKCCKKLLELSLVSQIERKIVKAQTRKAFLETAVPLLQKELENACFDITGCATVSSMKDPESWGTRSDRETRAIFGANRTRR